MTKSEERVIQALVETEIPKEDALNILQFMETPEMETELAKALEEKNFKMTRQEVMDAAGQIVLKHLE